MQGFVLLLVLLCHLPNLPMNFCLLLAVYCLPTVHTRLEIDVYYLLLIASHRRISWRCELCSIASPRQSEPGVAAAAAAADPFYLPACHIPVLVPHSQSSTRVTLITAALGGCHTLAWCLLAFLSLNLLYQRPGLVQLMLI